KPDHPLCPNQTIFSFKLVWQFEQMNKYVFFIIAAKLQIFCKRITDYVEEYNKNYPKKDVHASSFKKLSIRLNTAIFLSIYAKCPACDRTQSLLFLINFFNLFAI